MIVLDSSALLAIALDEPWRHVCEAAIIANDRRAISAGTLAEVLIVSERKGVGMAVRSLIDALRPTIVPVDEAMACLAFDAFRKFGKGRHPAALNYGDCFTYAVAKHLELPILFVGEDFSRTDIMSVLPLV